MTDAPHLAVALVFARFEQLAHPRGGQASPVAQPSSLQLWLQYAGVWSSSAGQERPSQHDAVSLLFPTSYDVGAHDPEHLGRAAMRKMCNQQLAEPFGRGLYRRVEQRG